MIENTFICQKCDFSEVICNLSLLHYDRIYINIFLKSEITFGFFERTA